MPGRKGARGRGKLNYREWVRQVNVLCKIACRPEMLSEFVDQESTVEEVEGRLIDLSDRGSSCDGMLEKMPTPHMVQ